MDKIMKLTKKKSGKGKNKAEATTAEAIATTVELNVPSDVYIYDLRSSRMICPRMAFACGGTAEVYHAVNPGHLPVGGPIQLAIKRSRQGCIKYLQAELDCLMKLRRDNPQNYPPNLINLVGVINHSSDDFIALVLPYAEHGNLYENIQKEMHGILSWNTRLLIIRGIIIGLRAIHRSGYVLRDLKTENILLDQENNPIITDMGSVCVADEPNDNVVYTPGYADPEYVRNQVV